jgi:RNA polymerase sigma factor for flagellar operon FliA
VTQNEPPASPDSDDQSRIEELVATHLPLARHAVNAVAARVALPGHVNRDDLLSGAQMALVESARRYDPATGVPFAAYARTRLQGAVLDELRAMDWASRTVRAEARRLESAYDALTYELGQAPSRQQVAQRLGVAEVEVASLQADIHRAVVVSFEEYTSESGSLPSAGAAPERIVLGQERVGYLLDAISALPDRLGEVIERNFFDEEALTSIAQDLGVTLSRVSQMRSQGLRLLNAALTEVADGGTAVESGGVRARAQQRTYIDKVAATSPDYRTRLATGAARYRHAG